MSPAHSGSGPVRPAWLALRTEAILSPLQPIVDAHHHLFDRPGWRYLLHDLLDDVQGGHDVRATIYVQARAMLRADGPDSLRPVGETEFANSVANVAATHLGGSMLACHGIVSQANLLLGDAVRPVLEAHLAAAGGPPAGRLRGIRHICAWDPDPSLVNPAYPSTADMLDSSAFRAGFAHLAPLGLSFDAWLYFHQIPQLTALARVFPDTRIVLDHCGGVLGTGSYAGRKDAVFVQWSAGLRELALCPNVSVKLGGLGMPQAGFGHEHKDVPPSSADLAQAWRPWMEECITAFGASRCMFESNFPVDKVSYDYTIGWNAAKRIAQSASEDEKADLFWRTAARVYRLSLPGLNSAQ
jgi:L-fuconolactonase